MSHEPPSAFPHNFDDWVADLFSPPALTLRADVPEPPPMPSEGPDIVDLVRADLEVRAMFGAKKYGTFLQPHNGRDALMDAYQEALDLCMYLRQALEERS